MDILVIGSLLYILGWAIGYFTGHAIALHKVELALQKSRQRSVNDLYGNKHDKSN